TGQPPRHQERSRRLDVRRAARSRDGDRPAPAGGSPPPRLRIASRSAPPGDRDRLGHHQRGGGGAADARFRTPRRSKYFSKLSASTDPRTWISVATSPVQPVWWLAPNPAPLSPWKYS